MGNSFEDRVEVEIDPDVWLKSKRQQALASEGRAENQCSCGAYTTTGAPPVLHRPGCEHDPFPPVAPVEPPEWLW